MNKFKTTAAICTVSVLLMGCGDDAPKEEAISEEIIQADLNKNFDESTVPDIGEALAASEKEAVSPEAAPAAPGDAKPPAVPAAPAEAVGAIDATDGEGNLTKTPLQLMQEAVDFYHSPAERGIDSLVDKAMESMEFDTEQAEERARAIIEQKYQIPPLQKLEDLVKARILGKIPDAPDGKTWKYDPATKTVSLE